MIRQPTPPSRDSKAAEPTSTRWTEELLVPFSADDLRTFARTCPDARTRGYMLMIASVYEGAAPEDIARIWGVSTTILEQVLRRFAEEGLKGLSDPPRRAGRTSQLGEPDR